jgi:hypothetical protein
MNWLWTCDTQEHDNYKGGYLIVQSVELCKPGTIFATRQLNVIMS